MTDRAAGSAAWASVRKDILSGTCRAESWDLPELWKERAALLHVQVVQRRCDPIGSVWEKRR